MKKQKSWHHFGTKMLFPAACPDHFGSEVIPHVRERGWDTRAGKSLIEEPGRGTKPFFTFQFIPVNNS